MNLKPMFEAVIFDCDGVLVDSEVLALEVELGALGEIGIVYDESEFKARFMGMSTPAFFDALDADHRARSGDGLPDGFRELCHARYTAAFPRLREVPGACAAIAQVTLPKAVASSSGAEALLRKLHKTGLWAHFDPHVYSADHVERAKPAPDLYLHASQALGIAPQNCLAVEDSSNGVRAARAAGMTVWGFLGGGHMDGNAGARLLAAGADRLIGDWREADAALRMLG